MLRRLLFACITLLLFSLSTGKIFSQANVVDFTVNGSLLPAEAYWAAEGRIDTLNVSPGSTITLELDMTLHVPDFPESLGAIDLIGEIGLQPVAIGDGMAYGVSALYTSNGWSSSLTPSGIAIDNLHDEITLGQATVTAEKTTDEEGNLLVLAQFSWQLATHSDLQPSLYVPTFTGMGQVGDGDIFLWTDTEFFGIGETPLLPFTRLPIVLNVGQVEQMILPWTLFYNNPSDGSRGALPDEITGRAALSNRVRFDSPTYILPPGEYSIEPYLLNQLPNVPEITTQPLLPFDLSSGEITATIVNPNGEISNLPGTSFLPDEVPEGEVDGNHVFQLNTLEPLYSAYPFTDYGDYQIQLNGNINDIYGNYYTGGGTYHLTIAEPLDLIPGVLPGTPFHVGDAFFAGGHISPPVPAQVTIKMMVYTLDGGIIEQEFTGNANRYGYFTLNTEPFIFDVPGEYTIDYEARYTDAEGKQWAASMRSAGIVADPDSTLIAHGARGLASDDDLTGLYRPAWFNMDNYPPYATPQEITDRPYYPYHSGDVAIIHDSAESGIYPFLTAQDIGDAYRHWLMDNLPDYVSPFGLPFERLDAIGELPLLNIPGNDAYAYISAVRPDVTVRQFVIGQQDSALPVYWDSDDLHNQQIGAGADGDRPGDYIFMFGGTVIRNEIGINTTIGYASLAVVADDNVLSGVYPPYTVPLLIVNDELIYTFFHPTGIRPGQILTVGDSFAVAGQVAPTRSAQVIVNITSPGGIVRQFTGITNSTGYYYHPSDTFVVGESGAWTVQITTTPVGMASNGILQEPLPVGGVLGVENHTFEVYVLPENSESLGWILGDSADTDIYPGVVYDFNLITPEGWTDIQTYYTVSTESYVLDSGEMINWGNTLFYEIIPVRLSANFPNLETSGRGEGPSGSDVITLTFVATGNDADGNPAIRARTFTLLHDRMVTFGD